MVDAACSAYSWDWCWPAQLSEYGRFAVCAKSMRERSTLCGHRRHAQAELKGRVLYASQLDNKHCYSCGKHGRCW